TMLAGFVVGILLARGLGVEGYGQYGIAMAVITIAGVPGELGLPRLVMRETAAAHARKDWPIFFGVIRWADSTSLAISLPIVALIAVCALLFAGGPASSLGAAIMWGAPVIPLFALAKIRAGALQGLNKVVLGQTATILLRPLLLGLLLLGFFALTGRITPQAAMALNAVTAACALAAGFILLKKNAPAEAPTQLAKESRQWLRSTIPLSLTEGIRVVQAQLTILLLGLFAASAEVGWFRVAASTTTALVAPMVVINLVVAPLISRLHAEGDRARLQTMLTHAAQAQFAGVLVLALPLLVAGEPILAFIFGDEYVPAAGPLRLLLAVQLFSAALGLNTQLLNMTRHERRVTRAMAIALGLNVVAVVALAPNWGMYGAAAAYVISMAAWNLLSWRDARRLVGIETSLVPVRRSH
ncbi:MAG TPA: oligosaccharide flippase family protein, partial [Sphingomicrobium sp.]|nr:oligosaccharide flippase family protein [Sphingomicrobium sp.]